MRKVCPQCEGRKVVMVKINGYLIDGIACAKCDKKGYIEVSEDFDKEVEETAKNGNV